MGKPIILTVDDEEQVRNAVERDLRKQVSEGLPDRQDGLRARGSGDRGRAPAAQRATVALFLADQRMPGMRGTEFLAEARRSIPEARKVLLTAYADTEAAIQAINEVGPRSLPDEALGPPEEKLYPVLDDLLTDWQATAELTPYDGIACRDALVAGVAPGQGLPVAQPDSLPVAGHRAGP